VGGLVELSRATCQSTSLAVVEIRPTVFSFIGAGQVRSDGPKRELSQTDRKKNRHCSARRGWGLGGGRNRQSRGRAAWQMPVPRSHRSARDGADVAFSVMDRVRTEMLHRVGLSELLTHADAESRTASDA
jgi:hypothetical protein